MSTTDRNEKCFYEVDRGLCASLTSSPSCVSRLCIQRGILNISQNYRPPWPVTDLALLYHMCSVFVPHRKHTYGAPRPVTDLALLYHMYSVFVPYRKHTYGAPRPITDLALLYHMCSVFVPHRKHTYGPPRPVTGIPSLYFTLLFNFYFKRFRSKRRCFYLRYNTGISLWRGNKTARNFTETQAALQSTSNKRYTFRKCVVPYCMWKVQT
jgi:hypothetical protein